LAEFKGAVTEIEGETSESGTAIAKLKTTLAEFRTAPAEKIGETIEFQAQSSE
jgi:hypothetical protein